MDYQKMYRDKLMTAEDAVKVVKSGNWVDYYWAASNPRKLDKALAARAEELTDVKIRCGIALYQPAVMSVPDAMKHFTWNSWHMSGYERKMASEGKAFYIPLRYSEMCKHYSEEIVSDVMMLQVPPMDEQGYFHCSLNASHLQALASHTSCVIVEVKKVLSNRPFWCASIGWGLVLMAMSGFTTVGINMLLEKGMTSGASVTVGTFAGVAALIASVASGYTAEKLGFRFASVLWIVIFAVGCLLMAVLPYRAVGVLVVAYYMGYTAAGFANNMSNTIFMKLAGPTYYTFVFTVCFTIIQIFHAFASSLFAFSLNHFGGYYGALYICVGMLVAAIILTLAAGDKLQTPREGKIGDKKEAEKVETATEAEKNN